MAGQSPSGLLRAARVFALIGFVAGLCRVQAATPVAEPLTFFTNVADRLLKSHLGLSVTRIPVAPTNAFSLEAHRLLQVAANLYDATQTNWYPSVFRPVIGPDSLVPGGLAVTGFVFDSDQNTLFDWLRDHSEFGVPIIIGAKKGLPNFNEFVTQTTVLAARKLELRRPNTNSPPTETNQMYVLGISNFFGVEAWNSYTQACCLEEVAITVGLVAGLKLTNDAGLHYETNWSASSLTTIAINQWSGYEARNLRGGFQVPLHTNLILLTDSAYRLDPPRFEWLRSSFDSNRGFPIPQWTAILSNRLVYVLSSGGRILDFVLLRNLTNSIDLSTVLFDPDVAIPEPGVVAECWATNRIAGGSGSMAPTAGVVQQVLLGLGEAPLSPADWNSYRFERPPQSPNAIQVEIDTFRAFFGLPRHYYPSIVNTNLVTQSPFTPARKFVLTIQREVNDPFVHHMVEHLADMNSVSTVFIRPGFPGFIANGLTNLNSRYRPWGGNPRLPGHPDDFNRAVKDAGVFASDNWNFPTNLLANPGRLGSVHRGTPWQTLYLKSEAAEMSSWLHNWPEARSHPTNDWKTVSTLLPLFVTNDVRTLFSVNNPDVDAWRGVLHGITVVSNLPAEPFAPRPDFTSYTMQSNSPQAQLVADAVQETLDTRQPSYFARVGDVLATPELSVVSPWLNTASSTDLIFGLTDEAYEKIPEQLLPRLRSEPVLGVHRAPGQTEITVEAYAGYSYAIQASPDLQTWRIVAQVFAHDSTFAVTDTTGDGQVFYRVTIAP